MHTLENDFNPNTKKPENPKKRPKLEKPQTHGTLLFHNPTTNQYITTVKKQAKTIQEYETQ